MEIEPAQVENLPETSFVLCHDLTTLDERDLVTFLGQLPIELMFEVERKLRVVFRLV